jgi:hypothetical protein
VVSAARAVETIGLDESITAAPAMRSIANGIALVRVMNCTDPTPVCLQREYAYGRNLQTGDEPDVDVGFRAAKSDDAMSQGDP